VSLYSIRYAQHGRDLIRVAHDEVLRWYMSLDGKKWTPVDRHTLKSAQDRAHSSVHRRTRIAAKTSSGSWINLRKRKFLENAPGARIQAWSQTLQRSVDARTVVGE
jgi:hypothetical protein